MMGVDTALMLYCQQMEMVMISFRIDIARENDERMAYDRIDNLFLFPHPSSKERKKLEEVYDK
jgi:hypothetical protein